MKFLIDRFSLIFLETHLESNLHHGIDSEVNAQFSSLPQLALDGSSIEQVESLFTNEKGFHSKINGMIVMKLDKSVHLLRVYPNDSFVNVCSNCGSPEIYTRFPKPYCQAHARVDKELIKGIIDAVSS